MAAAPIVVKTTVNLPKDTLDRAKALATARNVSVSEVIKAALELETYVSTATQTGDKLLLEARDKRVRELVFIR
jgi:hypothetical protein